MRTDDKYFDSKEFKDILASYEKAVAAKESIFLDADDLTDIADYYNYIGDRQKAVEVIDFALQLNPGATGPLVFKTREALENEDVKLAEQLAEEIIDKEDPDYIFLKAEILIAQNFIDKADKYIHGFLRYIEPDDMEDFVLDAVSLYVDYGVDDKAYEWLQKIKDSKRGVYKELMARVLFGIGKYKESVDLCNQLVDKHPYSVVYWNALASAQFMNEEYNNSITSSEYALAIEPNNTDGLLTKANGLFKLGNYEEAEKYYARYNKNEPTDEYGEMNQGVCLMTLAKFEEAIPHFKRSIEVAPEDSPYLAQIYQEIAFTYSSLKHPKEAIEYLDKTDKLDCDHADMIVLRGHILLENGLKKEAETMFNKAASTSKNDPSILLRIIVSLHDNKYVDTSYKMFKKFFSLIDDDFNEGYSYMAICCWEMEHIEEFMHYLQIAVKRNPLEAKMVLGSLFPDEMEPKDYYVYINNKLNNKEK